MRLIAFCKLLFETDAHHCLVLQSKAGATEGKPSLALNIISRAMVRSIVSILVLTLVRNRILILMFLVFCCLTAFQHTSQAPSDVHTFPSPSMAVVCGKAARGRCPCRSRAGKPSRTSSLHPLCVLMVHFPFMSCAAVTP